MLHSLEDTLRRYQARVEAALGARLPAPGTPPGRLHEAMRYATLDGGKRVRAALVYAAGEACGAETARLDAPACAIELIHAYSLVHDDLPCMDNDTLRRGKPTCHVAYDEATALLVGDALQTLAFEILAEGGALHPATRLAMVRALATAAGSHGMAGGQAIDLASVGRKLDYPALEDMHARKTGALIACAVRLGALAAEREEPSLHAALDRYARAIGLAFQVADDILDVEGESGTLGKSVGKDQAQGKPTYPALLGLEGARAKARELHREALDSLAPLGERAATLSALASFVIERAR